MSNTIIYHIFTDGQDDYLETEEEAKKAFNHLKTEGYDNIRVYKEELSEEGETIEEECLYSKGGFPM